jgi:hypothetical protein
MAWGPHWQWSLHDRRPARPQPLVQPSTGRHAEAPWWDCAPPPPPAAGAGPARQGPPFLPAKHGAHLVELIQARGKPVLLAQPSTGAL